MEMPIHHIADLFAQLGLPSDPDAVEAFIRTHRPLPAGVALTDALCWTPSQAQFLREQVQADADWSEKVDQLAAMLSS